MVNIAELLKDCPQGMELDCTMFEDCTFLDVDEKANNYVIRITTPCGIKYVDKYGRYVADYEAKCVIFPKGKTTWEGFVPPCNFKDGDIVFYMDTIAIFKEWGDETLFRTHVVKYLHCDSYIDVKVPLFGKNVRKEIRFATEEEKKKLFKAIKDYGYQWYPETKTLEKLIQPKFKVGDYVAKKGGITVPVLITGVGNDCYYSNMGNSVGIFSIKEQDDWELAPKKFDINTLKSLESKVLMRSSNAREWVGTIYSHYNNNKFYGCGMYCDQCIPYEGNEHLLGTIDDCADWFKTWE
jgi:hypothetical protein